MSNLLTFSSTGIIVCALISLNLIPYSPKKGWKGQISLMLQWLLIPIVSLFLSAVPALDAQTRLMFGKYLEYKVTQKSRVSTSDVEKKLTCVKFMARALPSTTPKNHNKSPAGICILGHRGQGTPRTENINPSRTVFITAA